MITEKDTIKCEAIFNDERTHRFIWKRIWDKDRPVVTIIMLNACAADSLLMDETTYLTVNGITRLEKYGGINIVNLFSLLTPKLHFRWNSDEDINDPSNDRYIRSACAESEICILAWGAAYKNNKRIAERAEHVVAMLADLKDKLMVISEGDRTMLHPLCPELRVTKWNLIPFDSLTTMEYKPKPKKKSPSKEDSTETNTEADTEETSTEASATETAEESTEEATEPTQESTEPTATEESTID